MNKDYFMDISQFILENLKGDYVFIQITNSENNLSRFADEKIHQSVFQDNINLHIDLVRGKKHASISTNQIKKDYIKKLLKTLEITIKNVKDDENLIIPLKGESFYYDEKFDDKFDQLNNSKYSASLIGKIFEEGKKNKAEISGSLKIQKNQLFIANSYGNNGYSKNTLFNILVIPRKGENTTYNLFTSHDLGHFNREKFMEKPLKRLAYYKNIFSLNKGKYDVILEEFAAGNIFTNFSYMALNAESVAENRSYLSGKLGQRVVGENITLLDNYRHPLTQGIPFDFEFQKRKQLTIFDRGILKEIPMNVKYSKVTGLPLTGHAISSFSTALPINMVLKNGEKASEDIIKNVENGLLITRFHYTNIINPKETTFTGMTRNGVFVIENGKIIGAGNNLRFTINIVETLNNVSNIAKEQQYYYNGWLGGIVISPLFIKNFNFTGKTEF